MNNSTLSGNSADFGCGIFNTGFLTVNSSLFSSSPSGCGSGGGLSNGGWFHNGGEVTVNNSIFSNNYAGYGGGIYNRSGGTVTVNSSLINDNDAFIGGGISNGAFGPEGGEVIVNNSTISGNSTNGFLGGGGIYNGSSGVVTINNSTLTGNVSSDSGGGIYMWPSNSILSLNHSLISGNSASDSSSEIFNANGTINANNYNVIGYGGDARSYGFIPGPNDIIPPGALDTVLDILLADNGGPTFTHALVSGSVAIDVAPNAACLAPPINGVDQRGFPRNIDGDSSPFSNECDAGSFEFVPSGRPTRTPVPTSTSVTRTPPPITPTRTPTPRVTPFITRTPTATPQANISLPTSPAEGSYSAVHWVVASLLALGNLLFFRKWRD